MPYSLIQKGYITVLLGVVFLVLSFLPLYAFLPSCLYWESRPFLANGGSLNQELGFFVAGSHVDLDIYVDGGDQRLSVQVKNVGLDEITKLGVVTGSGFIAFDPPTNDYYTLYLENGYQFFSQNGKQILVKVYYYFYNYIFLALGITILAFGVALILIYDHKTRARNRLTVPPAP